VFASAAGALTIADALPPTTEAGAASLFGDLAALFAESRLGN
jgi:hypothetical protein